MLTSSLSTSPPLLITFSSVEETNLTQDDKTDKYKAFPFPCQQKATRKLENPGATRRLGANLAAG